jgi:hypothetical protein
LRFEDEENEEENEGVGDVKEIKDEKYKMA